MSEDLELFGNRLRQLREQWGFTQEELARQLPVSTDLISRWERAYQGQGRTWKPGRQMFLRLLEIFAEALEPDEAHTLSARLGYKLTQVEVQTLFPTSQFSAHDRDHSRTSSGPRYDTRPVSDSLRLATSTGDPDHLALDATQEIFVGREAELAQLQRYLDEAVAGQGRVTFVHGAAGSGKSSLVRALAHAALAAHPELVVLESSCSAYGGYGTPYMPFRAMLNGLLADTSTQWAAGTIQHRQQMRLRRLAPYCTQLLVDPCRDLLESFVATAALRQQVRSLQEHDVISAEQMQAYLTAIERVAAQPANEQRHLFEQYTTLLHLLSQRQPLLLIIDDLHWADAASVSLLFHLGRHLHSQRILITGTYRTSDLAFHQQGGPHPLAPVIHEMQRVYGTNSIDLDQSVGESFVDAYLDNEPNRLDAPFRARLVQHTRGHAFFTVEMLRGMQARGEIVKDAAGYWIDRQVNWQRVPARIEGLIAELLARLPARQRALLKVASVQGETFIAEVLAQVLDLDEHQILLDLTTDLGRNQHLVVEQSIQRIGNQRFSQFRFRHALFQTYLYRVLGEVERTYLHERVGFTLETLCGGDAAPFTEQLAHHFQMADIPDKAAFFLLQTGKRAMRLTAHEASIQHLQSGLTLLHRVPPSTMRDQMELDMLVTLGTSLIATKGLAAAEVEEVYLRALTLTARTQDTSLRAVTLFNLWIFHRTRANYTTAHEMAQQLLALAEQTQDTTIYLEAHHALWTNSLYAGDFAAAHVHAEKGITLYKAEEHHPLTFQYGGHDPGVCCHIFSAYALWYLGYPTQSRQRIQAGIALARELSHAYSLTMVLTLGAEIYLLRREGDAALALLEEAHPLAEMHGFANWLELCTIFRGWAWVELGESARGIEEMLHGLAQNRAAVGTGTGLHCFAQLANAYGKAGTPEKGLALLDAALAEEDKTALRHWDQWQSELFRLRGELRLMQTQGTITEGDGVHAAAHAFQRAIEIARQHAAKLPELRAVVSLSRLWVQQGQKARAYALLKPTYAWFSEGFDTKDLQEAEALLTWLHQEAARDDSRATPL